MRYWMALLLIIIMLPVTIALEHNDSHLLTNYSLEEFSTELAKIDTTVPSTFTTFLATIGDLFTINQEKKAKRAIARVRENNLRILKITQDKLQGTATTNRTSDIDTLLKQIEQDTRRASTAINKLQERTIVENERTAEQLQDRLEQTRAIEQLIAKTLMNAEPTSLDDVERDIGEKNDSDGSRNERSVDDIVEKNHTDSDKPTHVLDVDDSAPVETSSNQDRNTMITSSGEKIRVINGKNYTVIEGPDYSIRSVKSNTTHTYRVGDDIGSNKIKSITSSGVEFG